MYAQHASIFNGLFSQLRDYYAKTGEGLDDILADFWAQLLERTFPLLHPQRRFSPDFLLCLTHLASAADGSLHPFGDSPRRLRLQVKDARPPLTPALESPHLWPSGSHLEPRTPVPDPVLLGVF